MNQMVNTKKAQKNYFDWQDPFLLEQQLTEEERMIMQIRHRVLIRLLLQKMALLII